MNQLSQALREIADKRALMRVSVDLQLQFEPNAKYAPMKIILAKARAQAMAALDALIMVDAAETITIRALQNEVRRYDDLVAWVQETITEGKEADRYLDEEASDELARLMSTAEGREQAAEYGVDDEGSDR